MCPAPPDASLSAEAPPRARLPLPSIGELVLRDEEVPRPCAILEIEGGLLIRPTGALARMRGDAPIPLPFSSIDELSLAGAEHLDLRVGARLLRLEGAGAAALAAWLREVIDEDPLAHAVLEGGALLGAPDGPVVSVRLSAAQLTLAGSAGRREVALDAIRGLRVEGPALRLSLELGDDGGAVCLYGGLVFALYAGVLSLRPQLAGPLEALSSWPAERIAEGGGAVAGRLCAQVDGLHWTPHPGASAPSPRLGAAPLASGSLMVGWASVERAVVHGSEPRRLSVVASHGGRERRITSWVVTEPDAVLQCIGEVLHRAQRAFALDVGRRHRAASQVGNRWSAVRSVAGAAVKLRSLAIRSVQHDLSVGLMVLAGERLWFLPAGGPGGTAGADDWACADLVRGHAPNPDGLPSVGFEARGRRFRLIPAADDVFVGRFWDHCRAPTRIVTGSEAVMTALARLDSAPRVLRVRGQGGLASEQQPGLSVVFDDALGVGVDASMGSIRPGAPVQVEIGHAAGVYTFRSTAIELRRAVLAPPGAAAAGLDAEGARPLLLLRPPMELRLYNQRRSFRVRVDIEAQAILDDQHRDAAARLPLRVDDLSTGGCGAWGPAALEVGMSLDLMLQLPGRGLRAAARVLRSEQAEGEGPARRRYGLCFEGLSVGDEERIQRVVLAMQGAAQKARAAELG